MVDKLVNSEINAKRIANVEYCFGVSGVPLQVPGRVLVGEGILTKICRKKPKSRQFFLFNDILIYGTILINKKKYAAQHIIPLEGLVIEDLPDEVVMKNGWLIKTSSKSFAVYAGSPSEKAEWIRHIKKCANDLLEQTGRSVIKEHAAVWIPDSTARICMHCNQTQFTMLNRRHHCRLCGSVVCGDCSRNRTVILHQSKNPQRVCDSCYNKSYNYLNTRVKLSPKNQQQISPASTTKSTDLQLLNDAIKTCVDDTINNKDSRVEDWVNSASEQITQHLKSTIEQKQESNDTVELNNSDHVNEIVKETENIKLEESEQLVKKELEDDLIEKEDVKIEEKILDENQKLNGIDNEEIKKEDDSLNDHTHETSDSEDEHNDLSSSVEDISNETLGKPTFYEDVQLSKDHIENELTLNEEKSEIDLKQLDKQLDNEKINDEFMKAENSSESDERKENISNDLVNKLKDTEINKIDDEKKYEDEKTAF